MRVLLLTSSARGHAMAEALRRSPGRPEIIHVSTKSNPGIRVFADEEIVTPSLTDAAAIAEIAKRVAPDLAVIGPDDPIGEGIADVLVGLKIPTAAPLKSLARIESSKGFARELLAKHGIDASPKFRVFVSGQGSEMNTFITQYLAGNYVVKYDALKGGKGVKVSGEHLASVEEGIAYAEQCIRECGQVVIEEKLDGVEFSLLSFVSGETTVDMPAVQDHKRAFEGDTGPNTGGMGTYTDADHSLPFLAASDLEAASALNRRVAAALMVECGAPYRGILYGGFMATRGGVKVIEYNARFGDPEALNLLTILQSDFLAICAAIADGSLRPELVEFAPLATVCKYVVPKSYPDGKDEWGEAVTIPAGLPENVRVYLGDVTETQDAMLRLRSSRAIGVVGTGKTIAEAEAACESACRRIEGPVRHRADIGTAELIARRVEAMRRLRA